MLCVWFHAHIKFGDNQIPNTEEKLQISYSGFSESLIVSATTQQSLTTSQSMHLNVL